MPSGSPGPGSTTTSAARNNCSPRSSQDVSENTAHTVRAVRLRTDLSSVEKLRTVVRALVLQRAGAPERFRVLDRTEAALPEEVAALHLKARREVLAEMRTIIEEGVSQGRVPSPGRTARGAVGHRHVQLGRVVVPPRLQPSRRTGRRPARPERRRHALLPRRRRIAGHRAAPRPADGPGEPRLPRALPRSAIRSRPRHDIAQLRDTGLRVNQTGSYSAKDALGRRLARLRSGTHWMLRRPRPSRRWSTLRGPPRSR